MKQKSAQHINHDDSDYVSPMPTWKIIWRVILFRKKLWLINLCAVAFVMVLAQGSGLIIRRFFDILSSHSKAGFNVWTLVALFITIEILRRFGQFADSLTAVPYFVNVMTLLRKNMLSHILKQPGASALPDSPGEAISRFRGDVFEIPLFALWMNDLIGHFAFSVIAFIVMWHINSSITILAVIPFIAVGAIANATTGKIEYYRRASRRATGIVSGFIGEMFGAVQAVKVATAENSVISHFRELNKERQDICVKDRLFNEILRSIFNNAISIGTGIILILAGRAMQNKTFTVGDFALFVFYLDYISDLMVFCGLLLARYRQIGVSAERMHRLMRGSSSEALVEFGPVYLDGKLPHIEYEQKSDSNQLEALEAKNLSYTHPNSSNGIKNVNFTIERGTFTVITGRNGSGKTTLLRVLLGLLPMSGGSIIWNGKKVENAAEFFVPPRSAYTAQVPRLFSDTLENNILMGLYADKTDIDDAVESAVMEEDLDRLDDGLETMVGPKGIKLSGGQMHRTAAIRMFVRKPELLVFDDLSSALDVETEQQLWDRAFSKTNSTCLVVSHRKTALSRADKIIVMKDGHIEAQGNLQDLLKNCKEMQDIWHGDTSEKRHNYSRHNV